MDSFKWYEGLYEYSRPGTGNVEDRELGPDGDLVVSMISTAVIPRLSRLIEGGAFDVYSERHVRRVVDLAEEVEASVETGNVKLQVRPLMFTVRKPLTSSPQVLLKSAATAFQSAIADTETLLAKFPNRQGVFDPEAIPARRRYLARRIKLLKNLLHWRKYTGERFGIGQLAENLVENMLSIAEGGWEVGGEEVARTVRSALRADTFGRRY